MSGEHFTALRGFGITATIVGVVLAATSIAPATAETGDSAQAHQGHPQHLLSRGVGWALSASLGYGILFWMLGYHVIPALGGMLTVWLTRFATFVVLTLAAIPAGQTLRWPRGSVWWLLVSIGLTDTAAFVANNLGLNAGHVGVATVLASLFSAVTVLLGWLLLRERLQRSQWFGVLLIFTGIVLVSL
jgi:drug/metabolite transporter (DMT)-like permease